MSARRGIAGALIALGLLALAGCGGSGNERPGRRLWTVMVYMDGDNDLEAFGIQDLNEMERVGSSDEVAIVVLFDRIAGFSDADGGWTGARRYLVRRDDDSGAIGSKLLEDLGEVDMARPETLRGFVRQAAEEFPADRFALVLWNHGAGWRRRDPTRGVIFDDTSNTFMTMDDLAAGLDLPDVPLDLVAFDASLMAELEVAHQIRDRAALLVASEESPPATGYPYDAILGPLVAEPDMDPVNLGRIFVTQHVAAYPALPVTQSLLRLDRVPDYAALVNDFGAALSAALPAHRDAILRARALAQAYKLPYYRDLVSFALQTRALVPDPAVQRTAAAVIASLPAASGGPVVAEAHNGEAVADSHGLSIYLPGPGQFFSGYAGLRFAADFPQWAEFARRISAPE
ncbi:MAG: hypothetical protein HY321_03710 [Armatimonadetes bacterium]|nr:hypothetical protein [Armatimonadota bacterium]